MSETAQEKLGPNAPDNSDFKQQKLKAWQPILTPYWVIFTFLTVGVVFLSIGVAVLVASNNVVEVTSSKYQDLVSTKADHKCKNPVNSTENSCLITQTIKIPKDMKAPVYVYYELDNFYQNHRRYVKSRADTQLRGDDKFFVTGCEPRDKGSCTSKGGKKGECAVYPCGLIAWSVFNDTLPERQEPLHLFLLQVRQGLGCQNQRYHQMHCDGVEEQGHCVVIRQGEEVHPVERSRCQESCAEPIGHLDALSFQHHHDAVQKLQILQMRRRDSERFV
jgi:hypothetical protein